MLFQSSSPSTYTVAAVPDPERVSMPSRCHCKAVPVKSLASVKGMETTFDPPMAIQNVKLEPMVPLAWPNTLASKQAPTVSPAATVKDEKVTSVVVLDARTGALMLDVKLVD